MLIKFWIVVDFEISKYIKKYMVLLLEKKVSSVADSNNYFYIRLGNKIESNNKKKNLKVAYASGIF